MAVNSFLIPSISISQMLGYSISHCLRGKKSCGRMPPVDNLCTMCSKWKIMYFKIGMFETITFLNVKCTKGHMSLVLFVKWRGGSQNHWAPWFSCPKVLQLTDKQTAQRSAAHEKGSLGTWAALLFLSVQFFPEEQKLCPFCLILDFQKGEIKCVWYFSMFTARTT